MKSVILGGGQDGFILSHLLSALYNHDTYLLSKNINQPCNTSNFTSIRIGNATNSIPQLVEIIDEIRPDYIFNTIAISSTLLAQETPSLCFLVNSFFPYRLLSSLDDKAHAFEFINFGSILERHDHPKSSTIYAYSKILANNLLLSRAWKSRSSTYQLPNHESPLRDDRFFIRQVLNKFRDHLFCDSNKELIIDVFESETTRVFTWAPDLLNCMLSSIFYKKEFDYTSISTKLNLKQLVFAIASVYGINNVRIDCRKSGSIEFSNSLLPSPSDYLWKWLPLMTNTDDSTKYHLASWANPIDT